MYQYPVLSPGSCIRKEKFGGIFFHKKAYLYAILNKTAYTILQLCDGKHAIQDIIEKIGRLYEGEYPLIEEDVHDFIKQLAKNKVIRLR